MKKINLISAITLTLIIGGCNDYTPKTNEDNSNQLESHITSEDRSTLSIKVEDKSETPPDVTMFNDSKKILDDIYMEVVNESIQEYQIAKKHGDLVDICVQAGLVVTAQLQAKNESEYSKWKKIEKIDCKNYENQEIFNYEEEF